MKFNRDNHKNRRGYYLAFVVVELLIISALFIFSVHWLVILLTLPLLLIDIWSNLRCAKRENNFIQEIEIRPDELTCLTSKGVVYTIPFDKVRFSIREKKFEKEKTEIEIRLKRLLRSKLIGRLHIRNWSNLFAIKAALVNHKYCQIKYRPEGFWSKYGTLTADIIITSASLTMGEVADLAGDVNTASDFRELIMPITSSELSEEKDKKAENLE